MSDSRFDQLIEEALAQDFSGWDFSWLTGRHQEEDPTWDYRQLVVEHLASAGSLLDMGTGGGEFLASLPRLPRESYASESYRPNITVARARLAPLGVTVAAFDDDQALPFADQAFDVIINRHESYWPSEVYRLLRRGGVFLTQQVGPLDCIQLNQFLGAPMEPDVSTWILQRELSQLAAAGLQVIRAEEELLDTLFFDIGAVVFYLKIIEWQIPDFDVSHYRARLLAMHDLIQRQGAFHAQSHRYLIEACRPGSAENIVQIG